MNEKYCNKCDKHKLLSDFHFRYKERKDKYSSQCKECLYKFQKDRWKDRKRKIVELMGGKCCKCGYDNNYSCLDLHHLDPNTKDYDWTKLRQMSWTKVLNEVSKCILVCRNCHGEMHNPQTTKTDKPIEFDNCSLNKTHTLVSTGKCLICDNLVYGTKYCSQLCSQKARRVIERPTREELELLIKESNYCAIGRKYGVSGTAVRKWAKHYYLI